MMTFDEVLTAIGQVRVPPNVSGMTIFHDGRISHLDAETLAKLHQQFIDQKQKDNKK